MKKSVYVTFVLVVTGLLVLSACASAATPTVAATEAAAAATTAPETAATSAPQSGFVVGFANGWIGNYWRAQLVSDFEEAAAYYKGTGLLKDYFIANSPNDLTLQLNQLNGFIDQGVNAIMPDPVSAPALDPIIARAKSKGILTVVTNDPAANADSINVVGDNYTWSKIETQWLVDQMGGKGNIVEITGVPGNTADILRQQAVNDVLANYPDIKVLASAPGSWDEAQAQQVMSTFLSTYPQIDGLLIQDVMAEGVIRAYEAAKRPLPIMTGDYTCGFIRLWSTTYPDLQSIGVPYEPSHAGTALGFTLKLLQGKQIDPDKLSANPMDPTMKNAILLPVSYVVTKDGDTSKPWCSSLTQCISLQDAVKLCEPRSDTYMLDKVMSDSDIDTYFK